MFEPRLALASLSGEADAEWAARAAPWAGMAFMGGIALDEPTRGAAREMVADRDRTEFLPEDPFAFMRDQLEILATVPIEAGFNVRAVDHDALRRAATICEKYDAVLEINAHCRQEEMCAVGGGEQLMAEPERLVEQVRIAADAGPRVSVKLRTEVPGVDLPDLSGDVSDAGADIVHVDAMDSESVVAGVVNAGDAFVIANNGVRDERTTREYLAYGADAVSVGRPSDDPTVLSTVSETVQAWSG